jgi:hypothetical protein
MSRCSFQALDESGQSSLVIFEAGQLSACAVFAIKSLLAKIVHSLLVLLKSITPWISLIAS